jgi:glycosyltransferase involved in cell wall biosynthesis
MRKDGIEVVHSHNPGIHPYAALAGRLAGARAVINTRHGGMNSQGRLFQERHFGWTVPLTDHVVFVSEQSRKFVVSQGRVPDSKTSVIFNGIQVEKFLSTPALPGAARPLLRFGTVGRMVPAKGHATLIDAFALLAARVPTAQLRIVGDGPLEAELKQQATRLNLEGRVLFEGPSFQVAEFLSELDVFILSSSNEGLPLVILEAMAAGLPIVSTRVGGVPEVAPEGEVAWYCSPGNPEALAQCLYTAANSCDLVQRGQRARSLARSHFTVSSMQRNYEALYRHYADGS